MAIVSAFNSKKGGIAARKKIFRRKKIFLRMRRKIAEKLGGDAARAGNADYAAGAIEQSEIATAEISPKFGECRILELPQRRGEEDNKTAGGESTAKEGAMDSAVQRIENYETRLYCLLAEELAAGPRRVDFEEYARKMGCSRSTVTRNVGKLLDAGIVGVKDGKLFLKE